MKKSSKKTSRVTIFCYLLFLLLAVPSLTAETVPSRDTFLTYIEKRDAKAISALLKQFPVNKNQDFYRSAGILVEAMVAADKSIVDLLLAANVPTVVVDENGFEYSVLGLCITDTNIEFVASIVDSVFPLRSEDFSAIPKKNGYSRLFLAAFKRYGRVAFTQFLGEYTYSRANGEASGGYYSILTNLYTDIRATKGNEYTEFLEFLSKEDLLKQFVSYRWQQDTILIERLDLSNSGKLGAPQWDCYAITGVVNDNDVRRRSGASTASSILGKYSKGQVLKIIGISGKRRANSSDDYPWLEVIDDQGNTSWVYGKFVTSSIVSSELVTYR